MIVEAHANPIDTSNCGPDLLQATVQTSILLATYAWNVEITNSTILSNEQVERFEHTHGNSLWKLFKRNNQLALVEMLVNYKREVYPDDKRIIHDSAKKGRRIETNLGYSNHKELPNHRFVAVCDILGFSNMLKEKELDQIKETYEELIDYSENYSTYLHAINSEDYKRLTSKELAEKMSKRIVNDVLRPHTTGSNKVGHAVFSDSIILWTIPGVTDSPNRLLFKVCYLISLSFEIEMPLRAAIAYGPCLIDEEKKVFLGQNIVDANATEKTQEWAGAICHDSCFLHPRFDALTKTNNSPLIWYNAPLKSNSEVEVLTLNWPQFSQLNLKEKLKSYLNDVEKEKEILKWRNTIKFFDHCKNL